MHMSNGPGTTGHPGKAALRNRGIKRLTDLALYKAGGGGAAGAVGHASRLGVFVREDSGKVSFQLQKENDNPRHSAW
jgi:hypothetical protein